MKTLLDQYNASIIIKNNNNKNNLKGNQEKHNFQLTVILFISSVQAMHNSITQN